jgi:Zn-dependent alcohol dehydrogenase
LAASAEKRVGACSIGELTTKGTVHACHRPLYPGDVRFEARRGLLAVLSAKQMGAERIIAMSRHASRQKLAREYGATDIVTERGATAYVGVPHGANIDGLTLPLAQVAEGYRAMDERRAALAAVSTR